MRILKYLFFLALLTFVALILFITTLKSDFSVKKQKVIDAPSTQVFDYVNNFENWGDFLFSNLDNVDENLTKTSETNTDYFTWQKNNSSGSLKTLSSKKNKLIAQELHFNGTDSMLLWSFKDTIGGTKVSCKIDGNLSFLFKVNSLIYQDSEAIVGEIFDKGFEKLEESLLEESNKFEINLDNKPLKMVETFYLAQKFTSKLSDIARNSKIVFKKINDFCQKYEIEKNGKPFVVYHTFDRRNKIAKVSFCIPIKDAFYIKSARNPIFLGNLKPFDAIKINLKGDYIHLPKVLEKANAFLTKNKLLLDPNMHHIEINGENVFEKNTEFYFVLKPKKTFLKPIAKDSIQQKEPAVTRISNTTNTPAATSN